MHIIQWKPFQTSSVNLMPFAASEEEELNNWNPTLLWLGFSFFFTGIAFAIGGSISVNLRAKKYGGSYINYCV